MNDIQLDVSLSVVGPRQRLLEQHKWPMALRVAVGVAGGPPASPDDAKALVTNSLPWNVWSGGLPDIELVDENRNRITCQPESPLVENPSFLQAVKDSVEKRGHNLCKPLGTLDFACAATGHRDVEDVSDKPAGVSWPGLLKTLSHLSQPTPSALKATWFFMLDRDKICEQDPVTQTWQLRAGATLAAAPAKLNGAVIANIKVASGAATFDYGGSVRTFCNVLALDSVLDHGLDELDNYWLTIRDSRDDSLLDLAHQLDAALTPGAMLGTLKFEELVSCCEYTDGNGFRRCTAEDLTQALVAWRPALDKAVLQDTAQARKDVIQETLAMQGVAADVLRERYQVHAIALLKKFLSATNTPVQVEASHWDVLAAALSERLLPHAFQAAEPGPSKVGEGVVLMVGDERLRLVHESQTHTPALDEVAAIQLWARRSTDPGDLSEDAVKPATWHALTAGKYVLTDDSEHAGVDRVLGCTAAYVDDVLYREYTFLGANMVCRNPLERAHREQLGDGSDGGLMLARLERVAAGAWDLRAVPLRYGDHYEFAASVIDRAGGQAEELTEPGLPWKADLSDVAKLDPPQRDRVHFLRRVPVGVCNLIPSGGGWPQTPAGVVLRCLEREPKPPPGKRSASICLVPEDAEHYLQLAREEREAPRWWASLSFAVEPPQTDEHTAIRWHMPPTNASQGDQEAGLEKLRNILTDLLVRRDVGLVDKSMADQALVADPAVSAIGIRWRANGGASGQVALPAIRTELSVQTGDKTDFDGKRVFTVAPGTYLRIGIHPLVSDSDFERLDATVLAGMVEDQPWKEADGRVYRAFEEDVVFVECATYVLPQPDTSLLRLTPTATGDVDVSYQFSGVDSASISAFDHVHQMRLSSRRWTWRNLPLPPQQPVGIQRGTEEWRRRLASGPPRDLVDSKSRDSAPEIVDYFDTLSEIDAGFVGREDINGTFPREAADSEITAAAQDAIVLFRDGRDGITTADYLQYTWTIRSRYGGVLKNPEISTKLPRRIALGFRGDAGQIKPPRVLAVLPLLTQMPASPRVQKPGDATPFLVILDEIWYREYGLGERLSARIAKIKQEIGEPEPEPTALRYGPLPDHSVDPPNAVFLGKMETALDCFGPFGFTLDRADDQALANATAFVLYPPEQTPAHYNLFVEFERWLDLPSGSADGKGGWACLHSDSTEALPMYTLPDSAELWPTATALSPAEPLLLKKGVGGQFTYDTSKLTLLPYKGAHGAVMNQYRYALILGDMVHDGGHAVDVFLPTRSLWLQEGTGRALGIPDTGLESCTHGVIAEVLLSGRFDPNNKELKDPLANANGLAELLRLLLPASINEDARGMFRRFSAIGQVKFS